MSIRRQSCKWIGIGLGVGVGAWLWVGCAASPGAAPTSRPAAAPSQIGIPHFLSSPGLKGFEISERYERRGTLYWTLTNARTVLKVESHQDLDAESARLLLSDGRMGIEALYANALSPYPGDISFKIETQKQFLPRSVESRSRGIRRSGFLLYANERFGYGATTEEQIRYKSLVGWIHCERAQSLFKIRWFVPRDTPDQELRGFFNGLRCD